MGLSYLNARYYNPTQGQFLGEDPVFWGQQNLQDPQSFNAYSYSENNPIAESDPSGRQCITCAGAEVSYSLGAQRAFDSSFGQSSAAAYGGDTVSSALYGFAYPWTLVAPTAVAAISSGIGNIAQQGLEFLSGDRNSFDPSAVLSSAGLAGSVQWGLGEVPIRLISFTAEAIEFGLHVTHRAR
jgi:RHS repeat-associated protein